MIPNLHEKLILYIIKNKKQIQKIVTIVFQSWFTYQLWFCFGDRYTLFVVKGHQKQSEVHLQNELRTKKLYRSGPSWGEMNFNPPNNEKLVRWFLYFLSTYWFERDAIPNERVRSQYQIIDISTYNDYKSRRNHSCILVFHGTSAVQNLWEETQSVAVLRRNCETLGVLTSKESFYSC